MESWVRWELEVRWGNGVFRKLSVRNLTAFTYVRPSLTVYWTIFSLIVPISKVVYGLILRIFIKLFVPLFNVVCTSKYKNVLICFFFFLTIFFISCYVCFRAYLQAICFFFFFLLIHINWRNRLCVNGI